MISSAYNGWINPETTSISGVPTILPGKFPTIEKMFGIKGGTDVILREAPKIIKKFNLQTFTGANGQQYVKLPNGKMQSLINYIGNIYEKNLSTPLSSSVQKHLNIIKEKNAIKLKKRFGTIGEQNYKLFDPAVELKATKGSINKVRGKYSNRNAQTANDLE